MSKKNILIVDDEKSIIKVMTYAIQKYVPCRKTITASDGIEALQKLKEIESKEKELSCLVVTDVEMPRMDGLELITAIKRDYNLPVVVMSGSDCREQALSLGASFYLPKPFGLAELGETIRYFLKDFYKCAQSCKQSNIKQ